MPPLRAMVARYDICCFPEAVGRRSGRPRRVARTGVDDINVGNCGEQAGETPNWTARSRESPSQYAASAGEGEREELVADEHLSKMIREDYTPRVNG